MLVDKIPRPRILTLAYASEPGRGSEPGVGWGLVQAVAEFADCVVLVAPEHVPGIRRWESKHPNAALEFIGVPEPWFAPYAKWHRIPRFIVYLAWLRRAHYIGQRLHRERPFAAAYHATYSVYWLPSPVIRFGIPSIWGPVGGGVRTPVRLWPALGWMGLVDEFLDLAAVRLAEWWPATRRTWHHVTAAIAQNEETLARLPKPLGRRTSVLNHVMFVEAGQARSTRRQSGILYVSSLESRKGPRLAIHALAYTPKDVTLTIVGDGSERRRIENLARKLNVSHRIEFLGQVSRDEVLDLLAETSGVVFTGLREEGGVTLAEAMLRGAPAIVLANGGARTVAASTIDPTRVVIVEPSTVKDTAKRLAEVMSRFCRDPSTAEGPMLDQQEARRTLQKIFDEALATADELSAERLYLDALSTNGEPLLRSRKRTLSRHKT